MARPTAERALVVMGVSGSGKTRLGNALASRLGYAFLDADDFHSQANVAKMRSGTPLTDADRWPWLTAIRDAVSRRLAAGQGVVVACSALKPAYRALLSQAGELRFIYLKADKQTIRERLSRRKGHFFDPALLDSQFAALEAPTAAETPGLIEVEANQPFGELVAAVMRELRGGRPKGQGRHKAGPD